MAIKPNLENETEFERKTRVEKEHEKLRTYGIVALILILVALCAELLVPKASSGLERCLNIALDQNKYPCLNSLALQSKNATICSYLPSAYANQCYTEVAEGALSPEVCTEGSNSNLSFDCVMYIANKTDSASTCGYLSSPSKDSCIENLAVSYANASMCNQISNYSEEDICTSAIYLALSGKTKNYTDCLYVSSSTNSSTSSRILSLAESVPNQDSYVNGVLNINPIYIDSGSLPNSPRDLCYFTAATQFAGATACRYISNSSLENTCNLSAETSTPKVNTTLNLSSIDKLCANSTLGSPDFCEGMIIITQAESSDNVTMCSRITNASIQEQCYFTLADSFQKPAYCSYITNATANQACIQSINFSG